jgi:hypothetical protein
MLDKCWSVVEKFAPAEDRDATVKSQLKNSLITYLKLKKAYLGDFEVGVNRIMRPTMYDALVKAKGPKEFFLKFENLRTDDGWRFNTPASVIKVNEQSKGGVMHYNANRKGIKAGWNPNDEPFRELAMFRIAVPFYFYPESIKTISLRDMGDEPPHPPPLSTITEIWQHINNTGMVPFEFKLCAYTKTSRIVYNIDLINKKLIKDFRDGRIQSGSFGNVSPIHLMYLDRALSSPLLPELQKKILQASFESKGMTPAELSVVFGITEKMARNHMEGLVKRGLLTMTDKGNIQAYIADTVSIEKFKGYIKKVF